MNRFPLLALAIGNITGIGPYGTTDASLGAAGTFTLFLSNMIGVLTIIGGLWFLFQIIIAGYRWISAGGDKQNVQDAQKRLQNALIGLIVVVAAYIIVGIIGYFLGLNIYSLTGTVTNLHP